jgi:hypothetical protein
MHKVVYYKKWTKALLPLGVAGGLVGLTGWGLHRGLKRMKPKQWKEVWRLDDSAKRAKKEEA